MSEDLLSIVGERLARLRWGLKLTTRELSQCVRLTPEAIESLEQGKCDFDVLTLWKLSEVLGALPANIIEEPCRTDGSLATDALSLHYQWLRAISKKRQQATWRRIGIVTLRRRAEAKRCELRNRRDLLAATLIKHGHLKYQLEALYTAFKALPPPRAGRGFVSPDKFLCSRKNIEIL